MKKLVYLLIFSSLTMILDIQAQPTGYYNGTENKSGQELKSALNDIISGHTVYSYFYAKEIFKLSDADPDNPSNIIEIYTGRSWPNDDYGTGGDQLNREHVWSKSHGNFGDEQPMDGDVHNLKPSDASVNTDKSNLDFDNGGVQHPEATGCYYSDNNWEPRDEDKGDVARIIFYMDTRYEGENGELDLTVVDQLNTYPYPKYGKLSTLLQWNLQDPPDAFERHRNDVIYSFQHNRNPFIDNPNFAQLIWGNAALSTVVIGPVTQDPVTPHAGNPITIHAQVYSTSGNISNASLHYGTSYGNLSNSLDMTGAGNDLSAVIPGQPEGTTVYFQILAQDQSGSASSVVYNFYVPRVFTGNITSIFDIQGQGASSPYVDQVVSTTGIVTANFGSGYFIQNGSGSWTGLYVYDQGRNPSVGDSIVITGTISEYYEKTEIKSITGYYFISANHPLPAPAVITCAQAGEAYEGVVVKVGNATCTDDNYQANFYMWKVNDGTGDLLVHNTSVFEYVPTNGEVYVVTGPLDYDFDEWKIQLRFETDVAAGADVTAPQIAFAEVITPTIVKLQFSEDVEKTSAETLSNYSVSNGISVQQASQHSIIKSQVFLTVSPLSGGTYDLTVKNVADLAGNTMGQTVVQFTSTGLHEHVSPAPVKVYPNPAHDRVLIELPAESHGLAEVSLFNVAGMKALQLQVTNGDRNIIPVELKDLPSGVYVLEVKGNDIISRIRIIKY